MDLKQQIKIKARELGFDLIGITAADPIDLSHIDHLQKWIDNDFCGPLGYMKKNIQKRVNPSALLEGARSVICAGLCYKTFCENASSARIASYAHYEDYHPFIKERLDSLAGWIESRLPASTQWKFRAAVDSIPLAEKALAQRAGLGFIGRNHLLIHPEYGGSVLLGELVTTLDLMPDEPLQTGGCGSCDRCIRACPTGALRPDGFFDARRCISCQTQYDQTNPMFPTSGWLFGCDECLVACPYTQKAAGPCLSGLGLLSIPKKINPREIISWDEDTFQRVFKQSCVQRIGLEKLKLNARRCLKTTKNHEKSGD